MGKDSRFLHVIAAVMTLVMLTGCAIAAPAVGTAATGQDTAVQEVAAAAEETAEEVAAPEEVTAPETEEAVAQDDDITEIKIILVDLLGKRGGAEDVFEKMNEITEKTIGVRASVQWSSLTEYPTAASLSIAAGDDLDIIWISPVAPMDFTTLLANGQLMDITDYVETEGKDLVEMMGDYLTGDMNKGRIYGIPVYRNYSSSTYLIMRKDILNELGLMEKAENLETWTEVEEIYAAVKDSKGIAPLGTSSYVGGTIYGEEKIADLTSFDSLGDSYAVVFADMEGNISLLPENEQFRANMYRMKKWWDAGYVYKDLLTTEEHQDTLLRDGVIFSTIDNSEMGVEVAKQESTGYEVLCVDIGKHVLGSGPIQNLGFAVPVTASEPAAAVRWINEVYKTPELCNLITWGIEGEHYVVENGVAKFPEGLSTDSGSYHMPDYMFGNYFYDLPWDGSEPDFREKAKEVLEQTPVSPYMGFVIDQSDLSEVVVAVNSCYQRYFKQQIRYGAFTDDDYTAYLNALQAADVNVYLQAFQDQLDAWMQEN